MFNFKIILVLVSFTFAQIITNTEFQNGVYTYTQKVNHLSPSPWYISPNGYGFSEYTWYNEDFEWKHSFDINIVENINVLKSTLLIRGWDVDSEIKHGTSGEYDGIEVNGIALIPGLLQGTNNTWSETVFDLENSLFDTDSMINVFIDIDMNHNQHTWATTLDYSLLTIQYILVENNPPMQPEVNIKDFSQDSLVAIGVDISQLKITDDDGDTISHNYRWFVDIGQGYFVDDEFAEKLDHSLNYIPFSSVAHGEKWKVAITAIDSKGAHSAKKEISFDPINLDRDNDGVRDSLDDYPTDPERAFNSYYPTQNTKNTMVFEDQWPNKGDMDLNDIVFEFNIKEITNSNNKVKQIDISYEFKARGATWDNALGVSFDGIPPNSVESIDKECNNIQYNNQTVELGHTLNSVYIIENSMNNLLPSTLEYQHYNTDINDQRPTVTCTIKFTFVNPINSENFSAPYNHFIYRANQRGGEIHLNGKAPTELMNDSIFQTGDDNSIEGSSYYITQEGLPWAMEIESGFKHPLEGIEISKAYPGILNWIFTNTQQNKNWHKNFTTNKIWKKNN